MIPNGEKLSPRVNSGRSLLSNPFVRNILFGISLALTASAVARAEAEPIPDPKAGCIANSKNPLESVRACAPIPAFQKAIPKSGEATQNQTSNEEHVKNMSDNSPAGGTD